MTETISNILALSKGDALDALAAELMGWVVEATPTLSKMRWRAPDGGRQAFMPPFSRYPDEALSIVDAMKKDYEFTIQTSGELYKVTCRHYGEFSAEPITSSSLSEAIVKAALIANIRNGG